MSNATANPLEVVEALQESFKPGAIGDFAVRIVQVALRQGYVWPDEVSKAHLSDKDKQTVGSAYRRLKNAGVLIWTAECRKAESESKRKGSIIFKYLLGDRRLADLFIRRNTTPPPKTEEQLEFKA